MDTRELGMEAGNYALEKCGVRRWQNIIAGKSGVASKGTMAHVRAFLRV